MLPAGRRGMVGERAIENSKAEHPGNHYRDGSDRRMGCGGNGKES